jgi:hypothetical protein
MLGSKLSLIKPPFCNLLLLSLSKNKLLPALVL